MPEVIRPKPIEVKMIAFRLSRIFIKILCCQDRGVHRRSLIGIRARLSKVIIIVLWENTEPNLVERALCKAVQRLLNQLVTLQFPDITSRPDGIVRRSIRIGKMKRVCDMHRSVISLFRSRYLKGSGSVLLNSSRILQCRSFHCKFISSFEGGHETHHVTSVSVIETVHSLLFTFIGENRRYLIIRKRISLRPSCHNNFLHAPARHAFFILHLHRWFLPVLNLPGASSFRQKVHRLLLFPSCQNVTLIIQQIRQLITFFVQEDNNIHAQLEEPPSVKYNDNKEVIT